MSNDTNANSSPSVVLKYYLYKAIGNPGFVYPIYVLYLLSNGLSYAEIGAIGAVQSTLVVVGEMPTGYVGDRIGRRNSLLVAQVLYTVSALGMILGESFPAFVVAFGLLSVGMTFVSGSADAWLYDILVERLDEERYTHVRGRGGAVGQWVMAATMIVGSLLYVVDPLYPFVALLGTRLLTFVVVLSLPKNAQYADEGETDDNSLTVLEAVPIVREKLATRPLRSFVAYMALFVGVTMPVAAYIQPITVDALESNVGSMLSSVGVPEAASLGVLYAAFTAVSAVASDRASDLEAAFGIRKAVLVVPMVTCVLLVLPAFAPVLAFPMFFALKGSQSILRPIAGQYLNDHVESVGRATVLSSVSMVYAVFRIPLTLGSGIVADAFSPLVAVAALGGVFLVGGSALYLWRPPVRRKPEASPAETVASD
ncbi:MFS transporter [Halorussus salinisoli]|uniref:MFS transporter n=1 Tax=Halorussus salinisoli TaxID=2558242 RepID=UPI0010C1B9AB|nr:MFS transporter [Halorussus salinisoli]